MEEYFNKNLIMTKEEENLFQKVIIVDKEKVRLSRNW